jgi:very-short-patch-repair endonuclease
LIVRGVTLAQPPRHAKALAKPEVCAPGAAREPRAHKAPIAASVWQLEVVRGRGDAEVARIAEHQRGIVARGQLLAADLSPGAIKHRLRAGHLHRLYPGVYLFGRPRLEPLAAATAAVVYAGGRGVLSHRTAASVWELMEAREPLEITTIGSEIRSRRGLTVHRMGSLSRTDVRGCRKLPVTSPARTLLDLAGVLDIHELEAAYAFALRRELTSPTDIAKAIARAPQSRGVANLRELTRYGATPTLTRSEYERRFLRLIRAADLPRPLVNAMAEGHEVDYLWPAHKLAVEFDGFGFHGDRRAFERDRLRDQRLTAAGYRVMRVTARQLDLTPEAVIARLATALSR